MTERYSTIAILLHWLIALLIVGMVGMGLYMTGLPDERMSEKFELYQLHKSFGVTVLFLSLVRLIWRLTHKPPSLPGHMPDWERFAAKATHWAFYGLMIGIPLSGWAMVSASPWNLPTVLFGAIDWPHLPYFSTVADKKAVEGMLKEVHELLAFGMLFLLVLHVAAALKHHFINRDNVLCHMLPVVKPREESGKKQ
ncbi:cytochrome b [Emcibacter sp.]|uniref:cytochrome b n=1 Tax=Emcibacter sp. TaxID=1979954 RepID=UPI003A958FE2